MKSFLTVNPKTLEYGNGLAHIVDFGIFDKSGTITNSIVKGEKFRVRMRVRFEGKVQEPIMAFTIKDKQGTELTGTNTFLEKVDTGTTRDGDLYEVEFSQKMDLQGGEYLLSLGCTGYHDGDFTVYHRLYDVCNITVISDKNTVGIYDMNSTVVCERM